MVGLKPDLGDKLASFSALTLLAHPACKTVSEMICKLSSLHSLDCSHKIQTYLCLPALCFVQCKFDYAFRVRNIGSNASEASSC